MIDERPLVLPDTGEVQVPGSTSEAEPEPAPWKPQPWRPGDGSRGSMIAWAIMGFVVDTVLVLLFAGLGRSEHGGEATLIGLLGTSWPFILGLALVWGWGQVWRLPCAVLRSGVPVWLGTTVLGLAIRVAAGGGIALPFVLVTTLTLGVFFLGWRLLSLLVYRLRAMRKTD